MIGKPHFPPTKIVNHMKGIAGRSFYFLLLKIFAHMRSRDTNAQIRGRGEEIKLFRKLAAFSRKKDPNLEDNTCIGKDWCLSS